uniref:von Hippel-Lindau disease tumour suppressor beta domain-containing protein n=1 Tax=Homalodisca liturata TaxID=320908 RepID=A0A1B6HBF3_9HEMI
MNQKPKSLKSEKKSFIRFVNKTGRDVDVLWLNYEGEPVKYHTISPDIYIDINTYVSHPWIFEDSETRDRRAVRNQLVFYPPDWEKFVNSKAKNLQQDHEITPHRIVMMITLPVYRLRDRCLQVLRDSVNWEENIGLLDQLEFELPKSVLDDLYVMILKKAHYL